MNGNDTKISIEKNKLNKIKCDANEMADLIKENDSNKEKKKCFSREKAKYIETMMK